MLTFESTHTIDFTHPIPNALDIPYVTADEAFTLLSTEFGRFDRLLETLEADDWGKPTACTAWTVRAMLAHQAGGYASGRLPGIVAAVHRQAQARPAPRRRHQ